MLKTLDPEFNIVDYIISEKESGKSYTEIRAYLRDQKLSESEINDLIYASDHILLNKLANKESRLPQISNKTIGYILIFMGVFVTIYTFIKAEELGGYYVLFYGPVITGLGLLSNNRKSKRKRVLRSSFSSWKNDYAP